GSGKGRTALVFVLLPFLLVAALVATVVLGMLVPPLVIGSGVDSFEGEERAYAKEALHQVRVHSISGSPLAVVASALRVTDVEACPDDDPYPDYLKVSAKVEVYTIFGIYYDTWDATCEGELFVPRHPDGIGARPAEAGRR
nr:hypothetical protein [Actinomycetota bacterium]